MTLKLARELREDARRTLAKGGDPSAAKHAAQASARDTFEAIAREYLAKQSQRLAADTVALDTARLEQHVFAFLGARPIALIEAPELLECLKKMEKKGILETARRVRSLCGRVFRYAIATGRAKHDIAAPLQGAIAAPKVKSFAAITDPTKVGALLRAIDGYVGQPSTAYALRLAPLVFVRPGELRGAEWAEFDLNAAEWRIPAERMKMKDPHIVPLSTQAVAILRKLHEITGDGKLCFPGVRTPTRPISDNTLNAALRRLGYSGAEQTAHGFRSIASTLMNDLDWNSDYIELQLAHQERDGSRRPYNRAKRLTGRRQMMQDWADYLDRLRGANVTDIQRQQDQHAA